MAQVAEKLIITVDVKDSAKAKKALKGLEAGFKQTGKAGKDAFFNIRQQSKGLRRDLGALRNNLLVIYFEKRIYINRIIGCSCNYWSNSSCWCYFF